MRRQETLDTIHCGLLRSQQRAELLHRQSQCHPTWIDAADSQDGGFSDLHPQVYKFKRSNSAPHINHRAAHIAAGEHLLHFVRQLAKANGFGE